MPFLRSNRLLAGPADTKPLAPLNDTINALHRQLDDAVHTAVSRHRQGDHDTGLTETLIAVRAAQALERLTGVDWDETLEKRSQG